MTAGTESMVRAEAVAAKLGVKPRTVRRWAAAGKIPSQRPGKVWLFSPAWLESVTSWPSADREAA